MVRKTRDDSARTNPPTATGKKLNTNGGNLGTMMKLNEGKYKVTCFARDNKYRNLEYEVCQTKGTAIKYQSETNIKMPTRKQRNPK